MDQTREIIYGITGQVVETYPPEWLLGAPSSATAAVYAGDASNDDTSELAPTVTVDAVSTTADVASGYSQANRRRLYLTATANVTVGSRYRLANAAGQCEMAMPIGIAAGDYVTLAADLAYDYAIGSTLVGLRMYWTVDAAWVADSANVLATTSPSYRIIWAYTLASATRRHYTYARLVRQAFGHGVTLADLERVCPDISLDDPAAQRGRGMQWLIDSAAERVRADLITAGWKPEQPRDSELVDQLVIRAALWHFVRHRWIQGDPLDMQVESMRKDYSSLLDSSIRCAVRMDVDADGLEGGSTTEPVQQLWFSR